MQQLSMVRDNTPVEQPVWPEGMYMRSFRPGDETEWCACCLAGALGITALDGAQFEKHMAEDPRVLMDNIYFLESEADGIMGTVTYRHGTEPEEGVIHMVGIKKAFQGRGLATPMLLYAIAKIIADGKTRITLTTDDWRLPAIKSYLKCGFVPCEPDDAMQERWRAVMAHF